jgi:hypothetical protein
MTPASGVVTEPLIVLPAPAAKVDEETTRSVRKVSVFFMIRLRKGNGIPEKQRRFTNQTPSLESEKIPDFGTVSIGIFGAADDKALQ